MNDGCMKAILMFVIIFIVSLAFSLLFAYFAVLLWNYVVPTIFGLPEITYWQMFALMVLVRLFVPMKIDYNKDN